MSMTRAGYRRLDEMRMEHGLDPKLPWGGRSPRALTKAFQQYSFRLETAPVDEISEEDERIDQQYRRFLDGS